MVLLNLLLEHVEMILLIPSGLLLFAIIFGIYKKTDLHSQDLRHVWDSKTGTRVRDKRRADRVACNLPIELMSGDHVLNVGRIQNLSKTGVCFTTNLLLKHGQYILVRLPALRVGPKKMVAQVIWRHMSPLHSQYGLRLNAEPR